MIFTDAARRKRLSLRTTQQGALIEMYEAGGRQLGSLGTPNGRDAELHLASFVGGVLNRHDAWRKFAATIGHWVLRGYGYWAVDEKQTNRFVGAVGLGFPEGYPELELGYWIVPEMQGKGYATEAGLKAKEYAFTVIGARTLVSYIDPDNEPSKRVAERLSGKFEEVIELVEHGPHCVYRYTRKP